MYVAECLKRDADGACSEAAVAWATVMELMSGDSLDRNWPLGVLALDVDVIERNSSHPFLQSLYAGAPAQRVSLALDLPAGVPLGTYDAAARARPSDAQLEKACRTLRMFVPELPLQPCGGDAAPGDLDLRQAAVAAPTVLRRDGTVGASLLAPRDTAIYSPASAADAIGAEEAAAKAAALAALRIRFGDDGVRESLSNEDGSDAAASSGRPGASSVILGLRWGAGHLAPIMATTGSSRAVLASTSLDTPPRTAGYAAAASLAASRSVMAGSLLQSDARFPSIVGHVLGARDAESVAAAVRQAAASAESGHVMAQALEQALSQRSWPRSTSSSDAPRLVDAYAAASLGGVGLASEEEKRADAERVQRALASAFAESSAAAAFAESSAASESGSGSSPVRHHFGGAHISLLPRFEAVEVAPVTPADALAESIGSTGHGDAATATQAVQPHRTRLAVSRVAMVYLETGVVSGRAVASALVREFDSMEESRVAASAADAAAAAAAAAFAAAVAAGDSGSSDAAAVQLPSFAATLPFDKSFIMTALRGGLRAPTSSSAAAAAALASGMAPGLAAAGSGWTTSLHRRMTGTGLHRDLAYAVEARTAIPTAALPPGFVEAFLARGSGSGSSSSSASSSSASASEASWSTHTLTSFLPRCRLALLQRLEASSYLDLDEVREQQRNAAPLLSTYGAAEAAAGAGAGGAAGSDSGSSSGLDEKRVASSSATTSASTIGLDIRAFARYIDVERPTSLSTQHTVALAVPLRERPASSSSSSSFGSSSVDAGSSDSIDASIASDRSGAYAEVRLQPAPGSPIDASTGVPAALSLSLHARIGTLFHVRYQSTGCSSAAAAAAAAANESSAAVGPAAAAAAAGSRGAWVDVMSAAYGAQLHGDGSVALRAPRQAKSAAGAAADTEEHHGSAADSDGLWARLAGLKSRLASFAGMGPSVGGEDEEQSTGTGPSELPLSLGVQWPYVDGCYAMAHLPLPTLHVQCDEEAPSLEDAAAAAAASSAPGNAPSGLPSAALAAVLRAAQGSAGAAGGAVDSWAALPLTGSGSSALPFHVGFDAARTPLLAPVPVGNRDHFRWVSPATASIALGGAALVLLAAVLAKREDIGDVSVAAQSASAPQRVSRASR